MANPKIARKARARKTTRNSAAKAAVTEGPTTAASPATTPPPSGVRETGYERIEAETLALRHLARPFKMGDQNWDASVGDLVRAMFEAPNRDETDADLVKDALLCAADDFDMMRIAICHDDDSKALLERFALRAEWRARIALYLDKRLELGLEREEQNAAAKAQVTP